MAIRNFLSTVLCVVVVEIVFRIFGPTVSAQIDLPFQIYRDFSPGSKEFVIDFTEDPEVQRLYRERRLFEDNVFSKTLVNFVYSSVTHRYHGRSVSFIEYDDPVDISMTRTPEIGPDGRYLRDHLPPWTLGGHVGFRAWSPDGARHYGAAMQFSTMGLKDGTVAMCLSTAPGVEGETRYGGHNKGGQHLVCQVLIMPNGDIVFGYNTDPSKPSRFFFQGDTYFGGRLLSFTGDAWSHVAPDRQTELSGRQAMAIRMMERRE
ncbi:hypothetical protein A2818_01240 [Candidatus Nomurabacteria bacterium RIFCSPHIGHO2_01_FULL_40_12]|uniref:Uncharacterized protein n=1 Tax=Candidatus Nomurabacteria bacterium RIFCSPHIGHO2_01_FULL_40_12 TaxID=1801737 RepID=A0A1F6V0M3_9BACT|nr:MAG: hypothetical protein A2818_01240 [Candidatus Nomurabacteria bacterium RIFCSPHIGHO2_01_FULL_40_12]